MLFLYQRFLSISVGKSRRACIGRAKVPLVGGRSINGKKRTSNSPLLFASNNSLPFLLIPGNFVGVNELVFIYFFLRLDKV